MNPVDYDRQQRLDLAAAYRLVALSGWDDLTSTHLSARLADHGRFLLNSRHLLFEEVTASSLLEVNSQGELTAGCSADTPALVNKAGFIIHSAVHMAREDAVCVIHTHSRAGMAVAAMQCGLLPLSQHALRFYNNIGIHDYEGIAVNPEERQRLIADLGEHSALILRNHGLLTVGRSVAEAFSAMYYLEQACRVQVDVLHSQQPVNLPDAAVCEHTAAQYRAYPDYIQYDWQALLRKLQREQPDYRL